MYDTPGMVWYCNAKGVNLWGCGETLWVNLSEKMVGRQKQRFLNAEVVVRGTTRPFLAERWYTP